MKKITWVAILGGCLFLLLSAAKAGYFPRFRPVPRRPANIAILSSSGKSLPSLFVGLPKNPSYALDRVKPRIPPCAKKSSLSQLAALLHLNYSVQACGICTITECGGTHWEQTLLTCNTGNPCFSSYDYTEPNPASDLGTMRDGSACSDCSQCGCVELTCTNGGPR